eukprot:08835.XXX_242342_243458_1 [CDS] Oithona nana genome sequencing.
MKMQQKTILAKTIVTFMLILLLTISRPWSIKTEIPPKIEIKKVLLMAYWRTGSSYFGQLLSHYPQTYYSYEPEHYLSNPENKWKNFGQEDALKLVGNIFQCNFNGKFMKGYLRHVKEMWNLALHSPYMVDNCHIKPKCLDDKTLHFKLCSNSTMNLIKSVRLRSETINILLEKYPNLMIIMLVRDPRGVMNSRLSANWCGNKPHCLDTSYCNDLFADTEMALRLTHMYPGRIRIVRYEDLVANRTSVLTHTLQTLGFNVTLQRIENFFIELESSTDFIENEEHQGALYYKRKPMDVATKWMHQLPEETVEAIEIKCLQSMKLLGYLKKNDTINGAKMLDIEMLKLIIQ